MAAVLNRPISFRPTPADRAILARAGMPTSEAIRNALRLLDDRLSQEEGSPNAALFAEIQARPRTFQVSANDIIAAIDAERR